MQSVVYETILMGSTIVLKLFDAKEELVRIAFALIKYYEDIFTVNREQSEVMEINHAAGTHPVKVSQPVYELVKCAKAASMIPGSAFNVAIGPLVKLWKIGFKGDRVPSEDEIHQKLALTRPQHIVLNDRDSSVLLTNFGMEIDLGGIAKGYITDRVRELLQKEGVTNGLINLGGNVFAMSSPFGDWSIGLKKPFGKPDEIVGVIHVTNKSVVTSGIYERYFDHGGKVYHHILDPKTGYPIDNEIVSVTIISSDSLDGDVWSTMIFGMGLQKGLSTLRSRDDIEGIFITKDKEIIFSSTRQFKFTIQDESYKVSK